jgi:DNA-binding NarL/FixJ family response regulator
MLEPIRVLLVDDHAVLRQGTAELLRREPDIRVVGEAENGQVALTLASKLKPDVVVMDIRMPVMSGLDATRQLLESFPNMRVLVLTAHDDDQYVFSLLKAGASGYLLKSEPIEDLVHAIRQVRDGASPLSPTIASKVVARMHAGNASPRDSAERESLSPRELEVLEMLAQGLSNQAIGKALFISDRTVQAHLTSIFSKMGVTSRLDAVLMAIRRGWLVIDPEFD